MRREPKAPGAPGIREVSCHGTSTGTGTGARPRALRSASRDASRRASRVARAAALLFFCAAALIHAQSTGKTSPPPKAAQSVPQPAAPTVVYGSVTVAQAKQALAKLQGSASFAVSLKAYSAAFPPAEGGALLVEQAPKAPVADRPALFAEAGGLFLLAGRLVEAAGAFRTAADAAAIAGAAATAAGAGSAINADAFAESRELWLLKAARCRLALGETQAARELSAFVVAGARAKPSLDRAALISSWAFLMEGMPREAFSLARDIAAGAKKGSADRREALFLQWLAASAPASPMSMLVSDLPSPGDPAVFKTALSAEYPDSAEAAVAALKVPQAPVPWLALSIFPQPADTAGKPVAPGGSGKAGSGAVPGAGSAGGTAKEGRVTDLQAGWFSRKENAEGLTATLKAKGFKARVEAQKSAAGEDRWAVLVESEGDWSKMQARLKDAGYESYPTD